MRSVATEQAVALSGILADPSLAGKVFAAVPVSSFDPPYCHVAEAINRLRLDRKPVSTLSVVDEMRRSSTLAKAGGEAEVHRIALHVSGPDSVDYALEILAREFRLRSLAADVIRANAALEDDGVDPLAVARHLASVGTSMVEAIEQDGDDLTARSLAEFLAVDEAPYDWLIPGLLERTDRIVITGAEGLGKSTLIRQIAISVAAGLNPFTHEAIGRKRVLMIDCENSETKIRRALRPLSVQAQRFGEDPSQHLWIEAFPAGIDLGRMADEIRLVRMVSLLQPSLITIGPLYKMHTANPNDEETARSVVRVLDRLREISQAAMVIEGHMPHGGQSGRDVRPIGSSLWLRWPEFGYGLKRPQDAYERVVDFVRWRGDRDERQWPERLRGGGDWPWSEAPADWSAPTPAPWEPRTDVEPTGIERAVVD